VAVWGFSPGTLVYSKNKTDHHDIAEIVLKVALNSINQTNQPTITFMFKHRFFLLQINCITRTLYLVYKIFLLTYRGQVSDTSMLLSYTLTVCNSFISSWGIIGGVVKFFDVNTRSETTT
jgi:hypothetical protein